jgi:hypothetical protein
LYFDGQHHLVDGHGAHLRLGFVGIPKQLAQDRGSPFRLLEDEAHFAAPSSGVFLLQQPLRIAENTGEGIVQLVRDAGNNLPKRREFLGVQQLGLESSPGGQIAVNFDSAQSLPAGAQNRPR